MNVSHVDIAEAQRLVEEGDERAALQLLHELVDAGPSSELRHEIHELATAAHESSHGLHKVEWQRLMLET